MSAISAASRVHEDNAGERPQSGRHDHIGRNTPAPRTGVGNVTDGQAGHFPDALFAYIQRRGAVVVVELDPFGEGQRRTVLGCAEGDLTVRVLPFVLVASG